jgi:hypothetical protein
LLKKLGAKKGRAVSNVLSRKPAMQKTLADISISLNFDNLSDIYAPVKEGELEGARKLDEMIAEWAPQIEEWAANQQMKEMTMWCNLVNELGGSVTVDSTLLNATEGWESCDQGMSVVLKKNLRKTKSIRKAIMMTQPVGIDINFTTPTEEEIDEMSQRIEEELDTILGILGKLEEEFAPQYEKLDNELMEAIDEDLGQEVMDFAEGAMQDMGPYLQSWDITSWNSDETTVAQLLAKKQAAAAASSSKKSNAGFYSGVTFGVLGVVASAAMIAACNKKKTQECEETLL